MYTVYTRNGATIANLLTLDAAKARAEKHAYAELLWERYEACTGDYWLGFDKYDSVDGPALVEITCKA